MTALRRIAPALCVGLAVSSGYPIGITTSVLMPAFALRAQSRRAAYESAASYYAGALWPLIPGARNFFGPHVPFLVALSLWAVSALLLALPWPIVWSPNVRQALWRAALGLALTVIPPMGIIGWASPLTAAGFLFPGMCWCGLFGCLLLSGALAVWPKHAATAGLCFAVLANAIHPADLPAPARWKAINTDFGCIAHGSADALAEYRAAEEIQREALSVKASVIVFPETVVPYWTASTDAFWQQTLAELTASGKTVLIGARIPKMSDDVRPLYDFSGELAVLRSNGTPVSVALSEDRRSPEYFNAVVIRGAQTEIFKQRVPVPVAMWNPMMPDSAPLNLAGPAILRVANKQAAILICYEQTIVLPLLTSMLQRPEVLIGVANDYWAAGTPIPRFQHSAIQSWARLFGVPYVFAVNR